MNCKKEQKYPDLSTLTIVWGKDIITVVIIHKNKSQYAVAFTHPRTGTKYIEHYTQNQLIKLEEEAYIKTTPLSKALHEINEK